MEAPSHIQNKYEQQDPEGEMTYEDFLTNYEQDLLMTGHCPAEVAREIEIMRLEGHFSYAFADKKGEQ